MADKKYEINFEMTDGSIQTVEFTAPQGDPGEPGAAGKTPVKGTDYFTEADKAEIAEMAAELVDVPTGGTSVQSDWNQTDETAADFIKNKPFGETSSDTLSWELSYTETSDSAGLFFKISDAIITMDDLENGLTIDIFGESFQFSKEDCENFDGLLMFPDMICVSVYTAGTEFDGLIFPEAGLYVIIELQSGSLTIPNFAFTDIRKIDTKYLPLSEYNQMVVYQGFKDGIEYIYKDEGCTEKLTNLDLYVLIQKNARVFVRLSDNHSAEAVELNCGRSYIAYFESDNLHKAYIADYEG